MEEWLYSDVVKDHFMNPKNVLLDDESTWECDGRGIVGNIKWSDMIGHANYSSERLRELDLEKLGNCVTIAQKLHRFLSVNNLGNATISSGWRSTRNNTSCGGETNSLHLKGRAIDFKLSGNNRSLYYTYFHGKWDGGYGFSPKWGHIHVDNGTRKNVYPN